MSDGQNDKFIESVHEELTEEEREWVVSEQRSVMDYLGGMGNYTVMDVVENIREDIEKDRKKNAVCRNDGDMHDYDSEAKYGETK